MLTRLAIVTIMLIASLPTPVVAQPSAISGIVADPSGGVLIGAVVTHDTGLSQRETVTDHTGRFAFEHVSAGPGRVTVSFPGFQTLTMAAVAGASLRIVLRPDGHSETVTVGIDRSVNRRVSSATKTDTPLRDIPQALSVVTHELIADQRMQNMSDVTRYMPGVGIAQGEGNRDTPILRGNSTTSDFFVDGVRDDAQYFRDVYNVERVEALKGPNAMIFGRGGAGGVINRVSRQAGWNPSREIVLQAGSWNDRRLTADLGSGFGPSLAGRISTVYESAGSYRNGVSLTRFGVNPTLAVNLGAATMLRVGYEHFRDERTADRGVSSFGGRPIAGSPSTFFGDPDRSTSRAEVNLTTAFVEHRFPNGSTLRTRTMYGAYDKFYQNVFPGVTNAAGTAVSLSAYNHDTERTNVFNQTDWVSIGHTGPLSHALLAGAEFGRQRTTNLRLTGYFTSLGPTVSSLFVPLDNPTTALPLEFSPGASDADNIGVATVAATYIQDQVSLTRRLQVVVGLRVDRFDVSFSNRRTQADLAATDVLLSPRVGVIIKPATPMSVYGNVSVAYLPRAGEQLGSLSLTNQALDPERFTNYEVGAKWDVSPSLAFTAAAYRLDRSNVAVPDPVDPTRSILADAQRTEGVELEVSGDVSSRWHVQGGYAYQNGRLTHTISSTALAGATLAMLPAHSLSFWNRVDLSAAWEVGLGVIHRGDSFTSLDNAVSLPAFTRADVGVFYNISRRMRAQLNVENVFDTLYYPSAHNNTNITPGSPRALRLSVVTRF